MDGFESVFPRHWVESICLLILLKTGESLLGGTLFGSVDSVLGQEIWIVSSHELNIQELEKDFDRLHGKDTASFRSSTWEFEPEQNFNEANYAPYSTIQKKPRVGESMG